MDGVVMVSKFFISPSLPVLKPYCHFLPMIPCSCLTCGISVGENIFISGCNCVIYHVDGRTSM